VHLGESFPAGLRIFPGRISQAIGVLP
jgi:hypothetical protein